MGRNDHDDEVRHWAEKLFYPASLKNKTPKKDTTSQKLGATTIKALSSHARIRAQIARTTRRTPEVMVKITNRLGAGKGMRAIRDHFAYISRNGKLELEIDTGERLADKAAIKDFAHEWQHQVRGKPISEVSHRREAFNIILSMPAGTPPAAVRESARQFLAEEFGGKHRYCFTLHTDTDKPHVHACVQAAPLIKAKRLNPRKADLQRWREGFAVKLRDQGIDANATPRQTRGTNQKTVKQAGHHARKRQPMRFAHMESPLEWPRIYKGALNAWQRLANALKVSTDRDDQNAAVLIEEFVESRDLGIQKKR